MQTGFSYTNTSLERAASNLGFQMSQIACDLKTSANANTQRIVDVLNNHWQADLQQKYNDARLELSQQKQNATLIAALKTTEQVQNVCNILNLKIPDTSTIEDVTYTANMAYADFYPELLNEHQCIKYAVAVANDKDGYTGIQFCRWVADVVGKKENIDWDKFK